MKKPLTEDTLNRLAKAIMIKHDVGYDEALTILSEFRIHLICDESVRHSVAQQAALVTAVNTGKRAFHGGVFVTLPQNVSCLIPWPGRGSLNDIVLSLGARTLRVENSRHTQTLYFGRPLIPVDDSYEVHCSGWSGGICPAGVKTDLVNRHDFATGGVLAGALAVACGFLRISGLSSRPLDQAQGFSLWRPDLDWLSPEAEGPQLELLPKKLWMLGLGHLGQAYLWNLALLPYAAPKDVIFLLQDYDRAVEGNFASGLLCEESTVGRHKTRLCSDWVEARGFNSLITERPYDAMTKRNGEEPFIACCGFDSAEPRRLLEDSGFDLVVEAALGADALRFDRVVLHTFPDARRRASDIWASTSNPQVDPRLLHAFKSKGDCGILADSLARKAVSSSFVGAFAGAFVTAEILRALNGGTRCEFIQLQLRHNDRPGVVMAKENYAKRVARSGFVKAARYQRLAA